MGVLEWFTALLDDLSGPFNETPTQERARFAKEARRLARQAAEYRAMPGEEVSARRAAEEAGWYGAKARGEY